MRSQLNDFIVCDRNGDDVDDNDYVPDMYFGRVSMDGKCNNFGRRLLDLCKATNRRIVNGRLGKDQGVGSFTYVSQNGASVVDYLMTMKCEFPCVTVSVFPQMNGVITHLYSFP